MNLIRIILVALLVLSATLSGAMDAGHGAAGDHHHAAADTLSHTDLQCCDDSTERGQSCHLMPAVLADAGMLVTNPEVDSDTFGMGHRLPSGINLSVPLDPPRVV